NALGSITIRECLFAGNSATVKGGGIYSQDSLLITGCTFYDNSAVNGAAIFLRYSSTSVMDHCLVAYSPEGRGVDIGSTTTSCMVRCSDIFGNPDGDYWGALADFFGIDGNISANPLFCDTALADFSLATNSPCATVNSE
ncbi:MAG: right-handed parallel beta-helix repeat-containing protein, partial [Candidatus Zixiibacteriota bacterium]